MVLSISVFLTNTLLQCPTCSAALEDLFFDEENQTNDVHDIIMSTQSTSSPTPSDGVRVRDVLTGGTFESVSHTESESHHVKFSPVRPHNTPLANDTSTIVRPIAISAEPTENSDQKEEADVTTGVPVLLLSIPHEEEEVPKSSETIQRSRPKSRTLETGKSKRSKSSSKDDRLSESAMLSSSLRNLSDAELTLSKNTAYRSEGDLRDSDSGSVNDNISVKHISESKLKREKSKKKKSKKKSKKKEKEQEAVRSRLCILMIILIPNCS